MGSLPSQQLFGLGMKMKDSVSNKSARVRQKPASSSVTACALLHITHASYKDFQLAAEATKTGDKTVALFVLASYHPVTSGAWVEDGNDCPQVLPFMWRAHLPLACRPQDWHRVVSLCQPGRQRLRGSSGWQQSGQNSTLQANGRE